MQAPLESLWEHQNSGLCCGSAAESRGWCRELRPKLLSSLRAHNLGPWSSTIQCHVLAGPRSRPAQHPESALEAGSSCLKTHHLRACVHSLLAAERRYKLSCLTLPAAHSAFAWSATSRQPTTYQGAALQPTSPPCALCGLVCSLQALHAQHLQYISPVASQGCTRQRLAFSAHTHAMAPTHADKLLSAY